MEGVFKVRSKGFFVRMFYILFCRFGEGGGGWWRLVGSRDILDGGIV